MTDAIQATCTFTVIMINCILLLLGKARSQSIQTKTYIYHKRTGPAEESRCTTKLNRMQRNNSNINHKPISNHSVWASQSTQSRHYCQMFNLLRTTCTSRRAVLRANINRHLSHIGWIHFSCFWLHTRSCHRIQQPKTLPMKNSSSRHNSNCHLHQYQYYSTTSLLLWLLLLPLAFCLTSLCLQSYSS